MVYLAEKKVCFENTIDITSDFDMHAPYDYGEFNITFFIKDILVQTVFIWRRMNLEALVSSNGTVETFD